jgi:surfactin synthase thioesterase subunit
MHEDYEFVPDPDGRPPLDVPVVAVRGAADHLVSAADLGGWRRMTSGSCEPAEVGGGHMYLVDAPEALLDLVAGVLR